MIGEVDFYQGAIFRRLAVSGPVTISPLPGRSAANFLINEKCCLHIKYSSKRLAPWRFSFAKEQQDEIAAGYKQYGNSCVALVCGKDGIVVLTHAEFREALDEQHDPVEWICVKRGRGQMYMVEGSNGKLSYKIGKNDGVGKLLSRECLQADTHTAAEEKESTVSVVMRRANALLESLGTGK